MPQDAESWQMLLEYNLKWIGFGTCVGLLAKALMPGRDPGGAVATLLMGIVGAVIGCGVYLLIFDSRISPISPQGLGCGVLGAFVLLLFYRMLSGFFIDEAGSDDYRPVRRRTRRRPARRRRRRYEYVDSYE
ncbi:MAG: GlsB/YeaQ/YmgE family stress response membrane protein [Planctomycetales bacterium]|nr:GlsB/YeaQ/YmgE family stress response membrane protein [Planctomycetales bacterium]